VVVVVLLLGGGSGYGVKLQLENASQLVKGNVVQVGGRNVGKVTALKLSDDGQAQVEMTLSDDSVKPLHDGTRAKIRSLGLSGVANRFIDLSPGLASSPKIRDGGVIGVDRTSGVVDLDALLDNLDPKVRGDVQSIVADAARALTPTAAKQTNAGIHLLNPAVSQLTRLGRELTADQAALSSLLGHTASVARVLALHRQALGSGIESTAGVLGALASQREDLSSALANAPASLNATTATLRRLRTKTLPAVDPVLAQSEPVIKPFGDVLKLTGPTLTNAKPVIARLQALVPQARKALQPLPSLEKAARPAIASTTRGLKKALPLITGLRAYTPELVAGFFSGFGGNSGGSYDANGHYVRVSVHAGLGTITGLPIPPGAQLGGYRTGMDARCPGGAEAPAADKSNPFIDAGLSGLCDPQDDNR
jgi:phospholipid/cholesterol/gamma-HCH transport system substrate-binding protein